jgi:hypothetical protein
MSLATCNRFEQGRARAIEVLGNDTAQAQLGSRVSDLIGILDKMVPLSANENGVVAVGEATHVVLPLDETTTKAGRKVQLDFGSKARTIEGWLPNQPCHISLEIDQGEGTEQSNIVILPFWLAHGSPVYEATIAHEAEHGRQWEALKLVAKSPEILVIDERDARRVEDTVLAIELGNDYIEAREEQLAMWGLHQSYETARELLLKPPRSFEIASSRNSQGLNFIFTMFGSEALAISAALGDPTGQTVTSDELSAYQARGLI